MAINYDHQRDRITSTSDVLTISTTGALGVPVGNTAQRPTAASGQIRFNTQLQSFEGYNGSGWSSLGGIVDVDQDTKITAESAPGSDEDTLTFTTAGVDRASINSAGLFNVVSQLTVGGNVQFNGTLNTHTIPSGTGTIALTSDLYTDSDVDTHLNQGSAITNQVLSWDGTDYNWVTNSGAGIVLSDISVGAEGTAAGDGGITYDNITGVFTYIPPVLSGITGNTDDITEGTTNLYYTTARANADFDTRLATKSTTDLAEGTNLYYTAARDTAQFNTDLATKSTTDLAEGTNLYYTDARARAVSLENIVEDTTPQLGGDLDLNSKDITGTGNINITGNAVISGYLAGPANFVIDPAGVGDNTGKVVIAGDLQVDGTTTTINSTTLDVDDLNITVAKGAADSAAANGAGLTVDGAGANITYTHATTSWDFNKDIILSGDFLPDGDETRDIGSSTKKWKDLYLSGSTIKLGAGTLNATGTVIGSPGGFDLSVNDTDDLSEGTTNLYYTSARANADFDTKLAGAYTDDLSEGSTNLYFTDARARASISVTDNGGDGSVSYDSSTGVISYTGPSAAEVRAHVSASGDLTYTQSTGVFSVTTYKSTDFDTDFGNKSTDDLSEGTTNLYYTDARVEAVSINEVVEDTTPQLGGDLDLNSKDITGTGNINITGNATVSGYLAGPANFVIDPAGVGDNTGKVVIAGDLQVDGTTTTINSTTLDVDDLNITVAKGSASAAAANGAGLTVDGANATLTYTNTDDRWNLNKELNVSRVHGNVTGNVTGTVSDISNHNTDALSEGSTNLYFTDTRARSAISGGTGVTYTPSTGVIEIGQDVATTSDVTFNDATFDGEVTIEGDLTVKGTTTSVNSNEVNIGDSIILLNSDETSTPSQNGGIEIERGTSDNVRFVWDEVNDRWSAEIYDTTTSAFISAKLTANEFIGDVTGNITGQVTDISNFTTDDLTEGTTNLYYTDARTLAKINVSSINELSDVDTATTPPTNGQVLVYDGNTTEWVPGTVSGGGGGGNSLFQLLNL